jgi:hypothetical protein
LSLTNPTASSKSFLFSFKEAEDCAAAKVCCEVLITSPPEPPFALVIFAA